MNSDWTRPKVMSSSCVILQKGGIPLSEEKRQAGSKDGRLILPVSKAPGLSNDRLWSFCRLQDRDKGHAVIIAVLGRRDSPTDALEDYSTLLGCAFKERGSDFALVRVRWDKRGWRKALSDLWRNSAEWKGNWALVQYTALTWSSRGFPFIFLPVLCVLRIRGVRTTVVFHDCEPYEGKRLRDRARRVFQRIVMRCAYALSNASVLTVPMEHITWLPSRPTAAFFIPVGANLPPITALGLSDRTGHGQKTVVAFSTSAASDEQILDLALAVKGAAAELGELHFLMLGRTMAGVEAKIREVLKDSPVQVLTRGLLPAEEISRSLARSDVLLFTRGPMSTNRGSGIAAIACGLPVVAYGQPEPSSPLSEAGVLFVPYEDRDRLSRALVEVLTNGQLWADLHQRNLRAYERYFSWTSIAGRYLDLFRLTHPPVARIH